MANVLTEALAVLRKDGWCKDVFINGRGNVCALGAINTAMYKDAQYLGNMASRELAALAAVIEEQFPNRSVSSPFGQRHSIAVFNNHSDTTFEDIEKVFEKAALKLEEML